jgi:TetR/AcrR family transcriptional regulator, mexJK operon transcriptional repressor
MQRKVHKSSPVPVSRRPKDPVTSVPPVSAASDTRSDFLLDIAAELFLQKGFEATSVGEIARRAHASKETFYSKFTNKNELFRAVINRLTDRFAGDVGLVLGNTQEPRQALSAFGAILLGRLLSDEGIGLQNIVFMESRRFPEIASIFYELGPSRTLTVLAKYLEAQVKRGFLRRMDPKLAASHFVALLTSDMMMLRSLGLLGKPTVEEQAERCRETVEVFLRAYGPKE